MIDENESAYALNEALNKTLQAFGPDLQKRLQTAGFKTKLFKGNFGLSRETNQKIIDSPDLAGISYAKLPDGFETIEISVNRERIKDLEKVINYFSTPEGQYGPDKDAGWFIKNVRNVNPGDIYRSKIGGTANLATVKYFRAEKTGSGKFGTDQIKTRDKTSADLAAE